MRFHELSPFKSVLREEKELKKNMFYDAIEASQFQMI
jgi:hypothetical protein